MRQKGLYGAMLIALIASLLLLYWYTNDDKKEVIVFLGGIDRESDLVAESNSTTQLESALSFMQDTGIAAIATTRMGYNEFWYEKTTGISGVSSDATRIAALSAMAALHHVPLWLHAQTSQSFLKDADTYSPTTVEDIVKNASTRNTYLSDFKKTVEAYAGQSAPYKDTCTVILFDDETPYAAKDEGGQFWLGSAFTSEEEEPEMDGERVLSFAPKNPENDLIFMDAIAALYVVLYDTVKSVNPRCRIGMYPNFSTMLRTYNQETQLAHLVRIIPKNKFPDILMLRSYSKSYKTHAEFREKLSEQVPKIRTILPTSTKVFIVGQIHTTNRQGLGAGRTPSLLQIEDTLELVKKLDVDGYGYLGKNHHESAPVQKETVTKGVTKTEVIACVYDHTSGVRMVNEGCSFPEDSDPYLPNKKGQQLLIDDTDEPHGVERWEKGVELLQRFLEK